MTTYHDVIPIKYPQWSHPKIVEVHKKRLELVEKEIDLVIAVSNTTKNDLLESTNIPDEKIVVIYEGVDARFQKLPEKQIEEFRQKYNLPEKFILSIGGIGERRNLDRIKEASEKYPLIITGKNLARIPDDEMPLLYNSAQVLLYPSLYEGFGLPIIEAMACGLPVITSNLGSMSEVSRDAAILVDPKNINEIKDSLESILTDNSLKEDYIKKGIKRASEFNWDITVKETIESYKTLV